MVDLPIVNAWILHKELAKNLQIKVLDQLRFREELSDQLRAEFIANRGIRKISCCIIICTDKRLTIDYMTERKFKEIDNPNDRSTIGLFHTDKLSAD